MEQLRLKDKMWIPPGGWTWLVPETQWTATAGDWATLLKVLVEHYSSNGIIVGDSIEDYVEMVFCERLIQQGHAEFVTIPYKPPEARVVVPIAGALTVAYITNRRENKIEWFFPSLFNSVKAPTKVIVVDFYADEPGRKEKVRKLWDDTFSSDKHTLLHVAPKPTVWSGPHKRTKVDYFSPANARNTALCLCATPWIAFVDDLSVIWPTWSEAVYQAMQEGYIVLGTYRKVKKLKVNCGEVWQHEDHPQGHDSRLKHASGTLFSCGGNWLFGCSFAAPVEALLGVGGSPEMCDSTGLGSEDYCLGIALANRGHAFRFDQRMLTWESEEDHHLEPPFKRMDKGVSPNDKSHAMLHYAQQATCYNPHIRELRERVLAGEPFPVPVEPKKDWFDGQPLSEL